MFTCVDFCPQLSHKLWWSVTPLFSSDLTRIHISRCPKFIPTSFFQIPSSSHRKNLAQARRAELLSPHLSLQLSSLCTATYQSTLFLSVCSIPITRTLTQFPSLSLSWTVLQSLDPFHLSPKLFPSCISKIKIQTCWWKDTSHPSLFVQPLRIFPPLTKQLPNSDWQRRHLASCPWLAIQWCLAI